MTFKINFNVNFVFSKIFDRIIIIKKDAFQLELEITSNSINETFAKNIVPLKNIMERARSFHRTKWAKLGEAGKTLGKC